MILPSKHISINNSLVSIGAILISNLEEDSTVTSLWNRTKNIDEVRTFERFTLALDMLYSLGLVTFKGIFLERVRI